MAKTVQQTDPYATLKEQQRQGWSTFTPLEVFTVPEAAHLVRFAGIGAGQKVLDVGTGTGVVAVTAAQTGASVTGVDLTPQLLVRARENARLAETDHIEWKEADVEALPFPDASFDVVVSEFGHMFAPRHRVAIAEMMRVLKPGGTIAFSTWPPHKFVGLTFALVGKYLPPPPEGLQVDRPPAWGDPGYVQDMLGEQVRDVVFDSGRMLLPTLSFGHMIDLLGRSLGPVAAVLQRVQDKPEERQAFLAEYRRLYDLYRTGNVVRQDYLMTRATKR